LTFFQDSKNSQYIDRETESIWDLEQGNCQNGELKGEKLKELIVMVAFWFAWSTFYPNSEVSHSLIDTDTFLQLLLKEYVGRIG
jgi:hypothetical protein